jgi:hypothetical protein
MNDKRNSSRVLTNFIPEQLQNPVIIYGEKEFISTTVDISGAGIAVKLIEQTGIEKEAEFDIIFSGIQEKVKGLCVHSSDCGMVIGAFFINPYDQNIIYSILHN